MTTALLLTAWLGCQALDLGTTHYALHHGYQEANILTRGSRLYTVKVSVNVGMFALWSAHRHPVIPSIMAVGGCIPAALNLHTIKESHGHAH